MPLYGRTETEHHRYTYDGGDDEEEEEEHLQQTSSCSQGHRSSLQLPTREGGSICLLCFCNLISNPNSSSVHLSYALSQLSQAISHSPFLQNLRNFHSHLLISPLTHLLCNCNDEPIAREATDLVLRLCGSDDPDVSLDFVARIADRLSSEALSWNRRQIYSLHCLGLLLNRQVHNSDPSAHIKEKKLLISNLIAGLQLPSEEIQGEILFVLYKLSTLESGAYNNIDDFLDFSPKILLLSLNTLMKTQSDEVRLNCIALLTVLAQKQYAGSSFFTNDQTSLGSAEEDNCMQTSEIPADGTPLVVLFAEAVKGPLLSSDTQLQIGTLDLIFYCLSSEGNGSKNILVLVEQGIVDYVFEILRLSGNEETVISSCIRVLDLLSEADSPFNQRLAIGFQTLVPVLRHVAEVPFHPIQSHTLKLIWISLSNCPGIISRSQVEELILILTGIFKRHRSGELGMLPETFILCCSTFVTILKFPSSHGISALIPSVQEASSNAVLSCISDTRYHPNQLILHALYLLKEVNAFVQEENSGVEVNTMAWENSTAHICETHVLPWLRRAVEETEEEDNILGVLETFHSIMLHGSDVQTRKFAEVLVSSSWFSLSFGCLALYPTEKMKLRMYLMLSSVVDQVLGHDLGQIIRDAAQYLPSDPLDLLFLLGQKSYHDMELMSCQYAVLSILYCSSLYDDRLAEEKQVLASLEQYILVNSDNNLRGPADSVALVQLVHLYGLLRGSTDLSSKTITYSIEAEKLMFDIVVENELDLLSFGIHPVSLKWLFQQDKISKPLSKQILNFCRLNTINENNITIHGNNNQRIDTHVIAELVEVGDNLGANILVSLLKQLQEEESQEEDITSVVNLMNTILNMFPGTSNQFWLHGIGIEIHNLYCSIIYSSSYRVFKLCSLLIFNILRSIQAETLFSHEELWLPLTIKFLEFIDHNLVADTCKQEGLLVFGILSLVLHYSTNKALTEASKAIHLSSSLVSKIITVILTACSKGPALVDHDEETSTGETLIFVLLVYFFCLRSLHSLLPGTLDWQNCLQLYNGGVQTNSVIGIHCHDLCRLIHFGPPLVKLVASYCLLELLTRITEQRGHISEELKCSVGYLMSMLAVLEGLVFDSDIRVAINCGLCASIILGWEVQKTRVARDDKWSRLIVEELALSFTAPGLASKSFTNQHKAASHVAVALLKLNQVPGWMKSVFDGPCISGIVKNLSASNITAEMVQLFRMLMVSDYLKEEHITGLNRMFQVCRNHVYTDNFQDNNTEEHLEKVTAVPDDLDKIFEFLIHLMSSDMASRGTQTGNRKLLEEIDMFLQESSKRMSSEN